MPSVNKDSFSSSFPIKVVSFQWVGALIPLAGILQSNVENKSKSGNPASFPVLGKELMLSPLSIMHTVSLL